MTVLALRDVRKDYGTQQAPVRILHGIDLEISAGEYVAIVGPSGSGKSTLLNIMGTLDRPTEGVVEVAGENVTSQADKAISRMRARRLGFVFQQFFLLDRRTAWENVADGLLYQRVPRTVRRERAMEALERVGLGHRLDHRPSQLSGGECQRVAIARALVHRPDVLLADEPTGNLDSAAGATVLGLFDQLHAEGATIVMITHDEAIAAHTPRVVAIQDGRIVSDVTKARAS